MLKALFVLLMLWGGSAQAGYCPPDYPECIRWERSSAPEGGISARCTALVVLAGVLGFLLGRSTAAGSGPSKQEVRDAVTKAVAGRKDEGVVHGRERKLSKPLDAALKAVLAALEKLGVA